jgi:hypothetical protein
MDLSDEEMQRFIGRENGEDHNADSGPRIIGSVEGSIGDATVR